MVKPLFCSSEYLVDDEGFVISKKGKPLKPSKNIRGYMMINVMIDGKRIGMGVHTAVARAFCDGYSPEMEVNHKDGDKGNNRADNLEWVTPVENVRHCRTVLGFNNREESHPNARAIIGCDKYTDEIVYDFPSIISAGRYFSNGSEFRARQIQDVIWKVIKGGYGKNTYRGCVWKYK